MKILVSCFHWTAPILSNELKILWYKTFDNFPTGVYVNWNISDCYKINLSSRIANKVWLEINGTVVKNFDQLFDFVHGLDWDKYISKGHKINIVSNVFESDINSNKSTQSIANKAILKKLSWSDKQWMSDPKKTEINILIQIIKNNCSIFINTSWEWLHNRWYRKNSWDAPLKENLAASLIRSCNWHFKMPLLDPMCGSGTILIEAAMIARNIAPWLNRSFAFESFKIFDRIIFDEIKNELKSKIFDGNYEIRWYDIDSKMIDIAKENAKKAWVADTIIFEIKDVNQLSIQTKTCIVCNPPYGKRLKEAGLETIYDSLIKLYWKESIWCFISSWEWADRMVWYDFKIKNMNNNGEMVKVYLKK